MDFLKDFVIFLFFRKLENGGYDEITLLDLQLMKYTRPTLDLTYFFGSSTFAPFRSKHLETLLKHYHDKLSQELKVFGYENVYSFEDLCQDYEDNWVFGFICSFLHMQVCPIQL